MSPRVPGVVGRKRGLVSSKREFDEKIEPMKRLYVLALATMVLGCPGVEDESGFVRADSATQQDLVAVHGSSATDVWAVGKLGTIIHFDGTRWSVTPTPTAVDFNAVFAIAPGDAWAVGDNGIVLHWNGLQWSYFEVPTSKDILDVWASGPNDVWVLPEESSGAFHVLHWNGSKWLEIPYSASYASVTQLWGASPGDVWLASDGSDIALRRHRNGSGAFVEVSVDGSGRFYIEDLDGSAPNDVWAITNDKVLHFEGAVWRPLVPQPSTDIQFKAIWSASPRDVWLVANYGGIQHFDGTAWSVVTSTDFSVTTNDVWGSGPDDLWIVGNGGTIFRRAPPVISR